MRILYCIPSLAYGGAERQLVQLATGLVQRGHDVHVAFGHDGPFAASLASAGVQLHPVGGRGNHDPRLVVELVRLIATLRPDVMQTYLTQMDVLGGAAALLTRTPWVLCEVSAGSRYSPHWKNRLRRLVGRRATVVASNSDGGDAYWRAAGARTRHLVPNGIPLAEIADARPDVSHAPEGARVVLFAGRMDEAKNADALVEALGMLATELEFVALLCGDGPRRPALAARVAELGLSGRVTFLGYVANVWPLMKRADALVSLSRVEGSPNVVLEAMACGCPLVVSDIPAHRALLDESCAWLVPSEDAAAAAGAIRAALAPNGDAAARARVAAARAARRPANATTERWEAIYLTVRRPPTSASIPVT